jgi:putative sigma-54 modulation protein
MKVLYTGRLDGLTPAQKKKLEGKFSKLAKLLDSRGGEREAHVILTAERHLRRAEITVRVLDHPVVGEGTGADAYTALAAALERLEKQVLKLRAKKRDTKRAAKEEWEEEAAPVLVEASSEEDGGRVVYRVNEHNSRKPMTLEEALLEMGPERDYLVFRDAQRDGISVLVRRRDGHYDLIEA